MGKPAEDRRPELDVLRCIAMYLVIGLHCIDDTLSTNALFGTRTWWVLNVCSGFVHMGVPLFFMLSGCLLLSDLRTREVGKFYRRRLGKLLPPFLIWDVIYFLDRCAADGTAPSPRVFFRELAAQGSKYHLWFVYQMIGLYLLMPFLKRIVDQCSTRELTVFLGVVLLQPTLFRFLNIVQPVVWLAPFLALVEGYVGFLLTGYLLGSRELSPKVRRCIYALGVVGLAVGAWGNYFYSSPQRMDLLFNEGYAITHYLTSGACFVLARQYAGKLPQGLLRAAGKVSRLTYGIYLLHALVLDLIVRNRAYLLPARTPAEFVTISFLAVSVVSTAAVWALSHIPAARKLLL